MEKIAIWLQKGYLKKKAEKSEYSPMVSEIIHGILTRFTMHNLKNHSKNHSKEHDVLICLVYYYEMDMLDI